MSENHYRSIQTEADCCNLNTVLSFKEYSELLLHKCVTGLARAGQCWINLPGFK